MEHANAASQQRTQDDIPPDPEAADDTPLDPIDELLDKYDDVVVAADDTGMLASERLITLAEIAEAQASTDADASREGDADRAGDV